MPFLASEGCFWPLAASMRSEVKKNMPILNLNEFLTNSVKYSFFCRIYGLAVIEVMTLSGHLSNIDENYFCQL